MSKDEKVDNTSLGLTTTGVSFPISVCDDTNSHDMGERSRAHSNQCIQPPESDVYSSRRKSFLQILIDAEAAADSVAPELLSFKDTVEGESCDNDKQRIQRQIQLLLEKLKDFRKANKSVRQNLKLLQEAEADRTDVDHQIETLQKKIRQSQSENEHLKNDLSETQQRMKALTDLWKEEQQNIKSTAQFAKSLDATRAHLQGQLRSKESQNNRLNIQLRTLERTVTEQKLQITDLRVSIISLGEQKAQEQDFLKKRAEAHKLRAEKFEAAVQKCYDQLREKDAQLCKAHEETESRKLQAQWEANEKDRLSAHVDLLNSQITELNVTLQKEKDKPAAVDNEDLFNNAGRKIAELEAEVGEWREKYTNLLSEMGKWQSKETKMETARRELQCQVNELTAQPQLLSDTERKLSDSQLNLQLLEKTGFEKSLSTRQLQVQNGEAVLLSSSVETKGSTKEANSQLQEYVDSLQKRMDSLQQENLELVLKLVDQDEALTTSNRQLDQRSCDCQKFNRQLELALADVRQQVRMVKEQAATREETLEGKILQLEAERNQRLDELKLLRDSKVTAQKLSEARLKELQLSLERSESHNRSIQNYVDFLRKSYWTLFSDR